ncbi:PAAR domain-containing protein [Paraburkholderia sp. UYCP14C]|uniref:PAAR domain-containing protein n=1 Tax=Paraburkholderia sp. UYCP14C TaxID=2511130 RepID=UPI001B7D5EAF|nr:PAAR domain-containing protein [Paraburkholderia sp. UYCP14C]
MRISVARDNDSTTTGGMVIAVSATMRDNGKRLALEGEHATCGNCKGSWPMHGTGDGMKNRGKRVVVDDDRVLCPCGKNRVIAGADARCFINKSTGVAADSSPRQAAQDGLYNEQFTLLDEARRPLADVRYRIVVDGERAITGITNGSGQTERVATRGPSILRLQLEK